MVFDITMLNLEDEETSIRCKHFSVNNGVLEVDVRGDDVDYILIPLNQLKLIGVKEVRPN